MEGLCSGIAPANTPVIIKKIHLVQKTEENHFNTDFSFQHSCHFELSMLANTAQKLFQWLPYLVCCNIPEEVPSSRTALSGSGMPGPNSLFLQSTLSSPSSARTHLTLPAHPSCTKTSTHSKYRKNRSLYSLNPQNSSSKSSGFNVHRRSSFLCLKLLPSSPCQNPRSSLI